MLLGDERGLEEKPSWCFAGGICLVSERGRGLPGVPCLSHKVQFGEPREASPKHFPELAFGVSDVEGGDGAGNQGFGGGPLSRRPGL